LYKLFIEGDNKKESSAQKLVILKWFFTDYIMMYISIYKFNNVNRPLNWTTLYAKKDFFIGDTIFFN
jgi:hypothetical protein